VKGLDFRVRVLGTPYLPPPEAQTQVSKLGSTNQADEP
jgi:hypothetical protein